MSDKPKKKMIEVKGIGEVEQVNANKYKIDNKGVDKFYEANGVPNYRDLRKTLDNVKDTLVVTAIENLLKDKVLETKEAQTFQAGTGSGRMDIVLENKVTRKHPQTKEYYDTYGVVKTREYYKSPFKPSDKSGLFQRLSDEIKKANED